MQYYHQFFNLLLFLISNNAPKKENIALIERSKKAMTEKYKKSSEAAENEIAILRESEEKLQSLLQDNERGKHFYKY